jgi:hypothetical protein
MFDFGTHAFECEKRRGRANITIPGTFIVYLSRASCALSTPSTPL